MKAKLIAIALLFGATVTFGLAVAAQAQNMTEAANSRIQAAVAAAE